MKKNKIKINIIQPRLSKNRQDSFWYDGQIATVETDYGTYSLEARGEIAIEFKDETYCKNREAVKEALRRKYNDKKINNVEWYNNNWFEILFFDKNGKMYDSEGDVSYEYDEAIEALKAAVEEEIYKNIN